MAPDGASGHSWHATSAHPRRTLSEVKKRSTAAVGVTVTIAAAIFFVTGCASTDHTSGSAAVPDQPDLLLCQGNEVPSQALISPKPATELTADAAPALDGRNVSDFAPIDWLIAQQSNDRVMLMNKLEVPSDQGGGDIREYEYIVISTKSMGAQSGQPAWAVVESSTCSPTLDLGHLSAAAVALDPSSPPDPESDRLVLLVTEMECNSGRDADGRVEVVELTETESTVELVLGVRASGAREASCPSNPATPFTVELERPLADRVLLNAAVAPAREITASTLD